MSPALMKGDNGGFANKAYLSNPILSLRQQLSGLKNLN